MRRLLLDANIPHGLTGLLPDYEVRTAFRMGWNLLSNGVLLAAAEADGFDLMITADQNIRYQQNLAGRRIALVALSTSHWETVRDNLDMILRAVEAARPGSYAEVVLPRPPRRRREAPQRESRPQGTAPHGRRLLRAAGAVERGGMYCCYES